MYRIGIGNDHAGYKIKSIIAPILDKIDNVMVKDFGCYNGETSVDYPLFAIEVCRKLVYRHIDLGILICGTGIGMSITANKVKGIRAAVIHDEYTAQMAKQHNNANVLCFGARQSADTLTPVQSILQQLFIFLPTQFEERHTRRLQIIESLEKGDFDDKRRSEKPSN